MQTYYSAKSNFPENWIEMKKIGRMRVQYYIDPPLNFVQENLHFATLPHYIPLPVKYELELCDQIHLCRRVLINASHSV